METLNGLPIYDAEMIDGKFSHGTNFVSVVERPATKQPVFLFSDQATEDNSPVIEDTLKFASVDKKRGLIEGVLMLADTPIYRDINGRKFYLRFRAPIVEKMAFKFMKNGFTKNINREHGENAQIHTAFVCESWVFDPNRGRVLPAHMNADEVKAGSWIVTLFSEDEALLKDIEEGKIVGFSLEGDFGINVNLSDDITKLEKSIILDPNITTSDKIKHLKQVSNVQ